MQLFLATGNLRELTRIHVVHTILRKSIHVPPRMSCCVWEDRRLGFGSERADCITGRDEIEGKGSRGGWATVVELALVTCAYPWRLERTSLRRVVLVFRGRDLTRVDMGYTAGRSRFHPIW